MDRDRLTDDRIEAALARRAPGHADAALLRSIVRAASETPQAGRAWRLPRLGRGDGRWFVLGLVGLLATALAFNAIGLGASRQVSPIPTDGHLGIAAPSPSVGPSASDASCSTDTVRIRTGSAMPSPAPSPIDLGAGTVEASAFIASPGEATFPAEVWSVRASIATRIAVVDGPGVDWVSVDDVSADGGVVLISVGRLGGNDPQCMDLYLLAADGSTVERVTHNGPDRVADAGRLSFDGRYVAFPDITVIPRAGASIAGARSGLAIVDRLAATLDPRVSACSPRSYGFPLAWAPGQDAVAALCDDHVLVDVGGQLTTIPVPTLPGDLVVFGWSGPRQLLLVSSPGGPTLEVRILDLTGAGVSLKGVLSQPRSVELPPLIVPCCAGFDSISPDGSSILVAGGSGGGDLRYALVRLADGQATAVPIAQGIDPAWAADGRSIVVALGGELAVYDLASGKVSVVGTLPAGYAGGIWRRSGS